jgi:GxxExxY protein
MRLPLRRTLVQQQIIQKENSTLKKLLRSELKYQDITEKIIGAAMKFHAALGNGFQEVIYQRSLEIELKYSGLKLEREFNMKVYYRSEEIGERRVDFYIENKIMVEIKAITRLENVHLAQGKNYLEAYNMDVGLLTNFGNTSLEFKRLENAK